MRRGNPPVTASRPLASRLHLLHGSSRRGGPTSGRRPSSDVIRTATILSLVLFLGWATGCASSGTFRDGTFQREGVRYHLDPPGPGWERVRVSGNDLAWTDNSGGVIAVNSECEDHGDPTLKVLTDHLLIGFEERQVLERKPMKVSGRAALLSSLRAELDGVPVRLELLVLKKDGCVYDLTYLGPPGAANEGIPTFRRLVDSFEAEGRWR